MYVKFPLPLSQSLLADRSPSVAPANVQTFPARAPLFTPAQLVQRRASAPAAPSPSAPPPVPPKDKASSSRSSSKSPSSPSSRLTSIFRRCSSAPSILPSSSSPSSSSLPFTPSNPFPRPPGPPRRPSLFAHIKLIPVPTEEDEEENEARYGPLINIAVALNKEEILRPPTMQSKKEVFEVVEVVRGRAL